MEHIISILFYRKMSKKTKDNLVPIYMRITINGQRIEQSAKTVSPTFSMVSGRRENERYPHRGQGTK